MYTCVHSSIMQTSPSHMPVHSPYFTFGQMPHGPQAEQTPPNQTHEQHYGCVEGGLRVTPLCPMVSGSECPALFWCEDKAPADSDEASLSFLHVSLLCSCINKQNRLHAAASSLRFRLLLIHNNKIYVFSYAAKKSSLGKRGRRTFHLQVSLNSNLLKKNFEM